MDYSAYSLPGIFPLLSINIDTLFSDFWAIMSQWGSLPVKAKKIKQYLYKLCASIMHNLWLHDELLKDTFTNMPH